MLWWARTVPLPLNSAVKLIWFVDRSHIKILLTCSVCSWWSAWALFGDTCTQVWGVQLCSTFAVKFGLWVHSECAVNGDVNISWQSSELVGRTSSHQASETTAHRGEHVFFGPFVTTVSFFLFSCFPNDPSIICQQSVGGIGALYCCHTTESAHKKQNGSTRIQFGLFCLGSSMTVLSLSFWCVTFSIWGNTTFRTERSFASTFARSNLWWWRLECIAR